MFLPHQYENHRVCVHIYTDGSKNNEVVGCAAITDRHKILEKLLPASSVFTAELFAIKNAMLLVDNSNDQQFTIYSDSMSAIQAIIPQKRHPTTTITQLQWRSKPGCFDSQQDINCHLLLGPGTCQYFW